MDMKLMSFVTMIRTALLKQANMSAEKTVPTVTLPMSHMHMIMDWRAMQNKSMVMVEEYAYLIQSILALPGETSALTLATRLPVTVLIHLDQRLKWLVEAFPYLSVASLE